MHSHTAPYPEPARAAPLVGRMCSLGDCGPGPSRAVTHQFDTLHWTTLRAVAGRLDFGNAVDVEGSTSVAIISVALFVGGSVLVIVDCAGAGCCMHQDQSCAVHGGAPRCSTSCPGPVVRRTCVAGAYVPVDTCLRQQVAIEACRRGLCRACTHVSPKLAYALHTANGAEASVRVQPLRFLPVHTKTDCC